MVGRCFEYGMPLPTEWHGNCIFTLGSMGQRNDYKDLEPVERRIALMRLANASLPAIAMTVESSEEYVRSVLARVHVSRFMTVVTGMTATEIAPVAKRLTEEIDDSAARAFEVEKGVMENLYAIVMDEGVELRDYIRAQMGAGVSASTILDRAGNRAPQKTVNVHAHAVAPETLDHLAKSFKEVLDAKTTVDTSLGGFGRANGQGVRSATERILEAVVERDVPESGGGENE